VASPETPSQQPYLLRALYEWCVDAGLTPYIVVRVDAYTRVPAGYVRGGEIVLNVTPDAVQQMEMGNEWVSFRARFGGVAQLVEVPTVNVLAIYARETGEGMTFTTPVSMPAEEGAEDIAEIPVIKPADDDPPPAPPQPPAKGKPKLRVVK
jgi:stringent starvation protein B